MVEWIVSNWGPVIHKYFCPDKMAIKWGQSSLVGNKQTKKWCITLNGYLFFLGIANKISYIHTPLHHPITSFSLTSLGALLTSDILACWQCSSSLALAMQALAGLKLAMMLQLSRVVFLELHSKVSDHLHNQRNYLVRLFYFT